MRSVAASWRSVNLRFRLLVAVLGIVLVSLALSGVLTGLLLLRLEFENAKEQLARSAVAYKQPIQRAECSTVLAANGACPVGKRVGLVQFEENLRQSVGGLNLRGDRLILLSKVTRPFPVPRVVFDSEDTLALGQTLGIGGATSAGSVITEETLDIEGQQYLVAATQLTGVNSAGYVLVARPRARVVAKATADLIPLVLQSAGAALLLAVLVSALISRALTRPLGELQSAAEDIAAGNYSRRVRLRSGDEIGVVGQAFNRMADAVQRTRTQQHDFLANVSHELKTPLTSLIGFSQALMDGSLHGEKERERAASIVHEEAERVLRMSQELLDLARVESGQLALDTRPVDLGAQLQQEIELVRPRADARSLQLRLELPPGLPPVQADPERLQQILENLLDNAVKYAPQGSEVAIWAQVEGGHVATMVRNQVGSHRPDPERMFERFYRADPSRSSAGGGAGLGLAISRELAAAQDGGLAASLDGGTLVMRLDLPSAGQPPDMGKAPGRGPVPIRVGRELRA
jgi:two-component system OmpR family sensor kinase